MTGTVRSAFFLIALLVAPAQSLNAFDIFWHFEAQSTVAKEFGFSDDAGNTLRFGSFAPDYFGPFFAELEGQVDKVVNYFEFRNLPTSVPTHIASFYLHFDNINGAIDRNWKFDYLWQKLLINSQNTIIGYYQDSKLKDDEKKMLILLTLGSSLHAVQDFYCHTDWTHFDFQKMGFAGLKINGNDRAPTWFEARAKLGAPQFTGKKKDWKFQIATGEFPPKENEGATSFGIRRSHTKMNHDNSQLFYNGSSQIEFHHFGTYPATDTASAAQHQFYAYNTALAASEEWMKLLEKNPAIKQAIDFAKGWDLSKLDRDIRDDIEDALSCANMLSCILSKWDGPHPPKGRDKECNTWTILGHIHIPKQSNIFWGAFPKNNILQNLTAGFGDENGNYIIDSAWYGKNRIAKK
jgi:hypothetical protein